MEYKNTARPRGTDSARLVTVIETTALCGSGTADDPCYPKVQYWSLEGDYLGEKVMSDAAPASLRLSE